MCFDIQLSISNTTMCTFNYPQICMDLIVHFLDQLNRKQDQLVISMWGAVKAAQ